MAKETPEEKLLRIIESSRPDEKPLCAQRVFKSESVDPKGSFKGSSSFKKKAFVVVILCLGIFAALILVLNFFGIKEKSVIKASFVESKERINPEPVAKEGIAPVVESKEEAPLPKEDAFVLEKKVEAQLPQLKDLIKNFRIVGIIWSNAPQVMIEDVSDRRTYLLNQGNMLKDVLVKEILKDRVVLSYDNQETELR